MFSNVKFKKLDERIVQLYKTHSAFCNSTGMNATTLSRKLSGEREWKLCEIRKLMFLLKIKPNEIELYFFV